MPSRTTKGRHPADRERAARTDFIAGISNWLVGRGYRVGFEGEAISAADLTAGLAVAKAVAVAVGAAYGIGDFVKIACDLVKVQSGDQQEVHECLAPMWALLDLVGLDVVDGDLELIGVLFGDDLSAEQTVRRLLELFERRKCLHHIAPGINVVGTSVRIVPIIVYFRHARAEENFQRIIEAGWLTADDGFLRANATWLRTIYIDVPARAVLEARPNGDFARSIQDERLDEKTESTMWFDVVSLATVLDLGRSIAEKSRAG